MTNEYEVLVSRDEIQKRIDILGQEIATALDDDAIVIGLLQGAFIFMADIMRALADNGKLLQTDFLWLSSIKLRNMKWLHYCRGMN